MVQTGRHHAAVFVVVTVLFAAPLSDSTTSSSSSSSQLPVADVAVDGNFSLLIRHTAELYAYSSTSSSDCSVWTRCLHVATQLTSFYDVEMRRQTTTEQRCQKVETLLECVKSLRTSTTQSQCQSTSIYTRITLSSHWNYTLRHLRCACRHKSPDCEYRESCAYVQLRSVLSGRCDDLYHFNLQQNTRHFCHFAGERRRCQLALVRSACDRVTSSLASSLLRMRDELTSSADCDVTTDSTSDDASNVFRYSEKCPSTLTSDVDRCSRKHLTELHVAHFHPHNELVAIDDALSLSNACKSLKQFRACVSPLRSSCRHGVDLLLQYQQDLHKYLLKMKFICRRHVLTVYQLSVTCYRDVIARQHLDDCNALWTDVTGALYNVSAYQFYCQLINPERLRLLTYMESLIVCYDHVTQRYCGLPASNVLTTLLRRALNDPVFLRYRYRPDCADHIIPATTTTASITSSRVMSTSSPSTTQSVTTVVDVAEDRGAQRSISDTTSSSRDMGPRYDDVTRWRTGNMAAAAVTCFRTNSMTSYLQQLLLLLTVVLFW